MKPNWRPSVWRWRTVTKRPWLSGWLPWVNYAAYRRFKSAERLATAPPHFLRINQVKLPD